MWKGWSKGDKPLAPEQWVVTQRTRKFPLRNQTNFTEKVESRFINLFSLVRRTCIAISISISPHVSLLSSISLSSMPHSGVSHSLLTSLHSCLGKFFAQFSHHGCHRAYTQHKACACGDSWRYKAVSDLRARFGGIFDRQRLRYGNGMLQREFLRIWWQHIHLWVRNYAWVRLIFYHYDKYCLWRHDQSFESQWRPAFPVAITVWASGETISASN